MLAGVLIGICITVAAFALRGWANNLGGTRCLVLRIQLRNVLFRLRLVPRYMPTELAYQRGFNAAGDYHNAVLRIAEEKATAHENATAELHGRIVSLSR